MNSIIVPWLQISFNWLFYILEAPPSKCTSMKKATILKFNVCYVSQGTLPFIFSRYSLYVWQTDGWSLKKQSWIVWLTAFAFKCDQ